VETGSLSCFKTVTESPQPKFLRKYEPGDAFGELALLYNAPRAATITSDDHSLLWSLDRNTFNHIVKDASRTRREKYEHFLTKVKILETMEPYERSSLSDAFSEEKYVSGDHIIRQGEEGHKFYIIEEGEVLATKAFHEGEEAKQVAEYKTGDYFGERALLKNEPRAANIIAKTDCRIVTLDRHSFKRLMGPLENIIRRRMDAYENYVQTVKDAS